MVTEDIRAFVPHDSILDPGIERAVRLLQKNNVLTYESCQGTPGHAFTEPTVLFHGNLAEAFAALSVCLFHALPVWSLSQFWRMDYGVPTGPEWALVFREPLAPLNAQE